MTEVAPEQAPAAVPTVQVGCTVAQLVADLSKLKNQSQMVMIEVDDVARQIRGIRTGVLKTPRGQDIPIVSLVGHGWSPAEVRHKKAPSIVRP